MSFKNIYNNLLNKTGKFVNPEDKLKGKAPISSRTMLDYYTFNANKPQAVNQNVGGKNPTMRKVETPSGNTTPVTSDRITNIQNNWQEALKQVQMNSLNAKNELAISNRHAIKNMETYLKSLGLEGSGLGQSHFTNLASSYANQLAQVNRDEQQQTTSLNMDYQDKLLNAQEAERDNQFSSVTSLLSTANTVDELNNVIETYGLGIKNADGSVAWNEEALSKLSGNQRNELIATYNMLKTGINTTKSDEANNKTSDEIKLMIAKGEDRTTIENKINELKSKGYNTIELEAMLVDYDNNIKSQVFDLIGAVKEAGLNAYQTQTFLNTLNNAYNSGDVKKMEQAYEEVSKYINSYVDPNEYTKADAQNAINNQVNNDNSAAISLNQINASHDYNIKVDTGNGQFANSGDRKDDVKITVNDGANSKSYQVAIDWNYGSEKGIPNKVDWDAQQNYLKATFSNAQDKDVVLLNGRVWMYSQTYGKWGVVRNGGNGAGKELYEYLNDAKLGKLTQ